MNAAAGPYVGLDRYQARQNESWLISRRKDCWGPLREHVNSIGKCDRCKNRGRAFAFHPMVHPYSAAG